MKLSSDELAAIHARFERGKICSDGTYAAGAVSQADAAKLFVHIFTVEREAAALMAASAPFAAFGSPTILKMLREMHPEATDDTPVFHCHFQSGDIHESAEFTQDVASHLYALHERLSRACGPEDQ